MQNYYNPYQNYPQQMPMPRQATGVFAFVNGVEDARAYIVQANQTAYLLDNNSNHLFIKKADMNGRYIIEDYILTRAEQDGGDYVKKTDFIQLQAQITSLTQAVAELTKPKEVQ